jgi:hypothetical protein
MAKKKQVKKAATKKTPKKYVSIKASKEPKEAAPPAGSKWKQVAIKLTPAQQKELRDAGVDTTKISIVTYDISRLGSAMPN